MNLRHYSVACLMLKMRYTRWGGVKVTKLSILALLLISSFRALAQADFETVVVPLGSCKVEKTEVTAVFSGETVTMDQQPYSKNMFVIFLDATGNQVPNPADDEKARASIPASDEVTIKEKDELLQIVYRSSKLDNGSLSLNTESGNAQLKRYLAFKGGIFGKKEVVENFSMNLESCALDVDALTKAVQARQN